VSETRVEKNRFEGKANTLQPSNSNSKVVCQNPNWTRPGQGWLARPELTEEKIKEMVLAALIELNLVPIADKKKAISNE
jgi:hypothetical protein